MTDTLLTPMLLDVLGSQPPAVPRAAAAHRHPWATRSGVVVGGAASLAIGAVLGGVLQGITVHTPADGGASRSVRVAAAGGGTLATLADHAVVALPVVAAHASGPLAPTAEARPSVPSSSAAGTPAHGSVPVHVVSAPVSVPTVTASEPIPVLSAPAGGSTTPPTSTRSTDPGSSGAGGSGSGSTCGLCSAVGTVTGTLQKVTSALPGVGGTVSGVVGAVGGSVSGVLGTVSATVAGATGSASSGAGGSATDGATGSASGSAGSASDAAGTLVAPVTGAVGSVVGGVASALGGL